jgi:hypothetical protein
VVIGIVCEKTEIMKHDEKNKRRIDPTPFMSAIMKNMKQLHYYYPSLVLLGFIVATDKGG